MLSFNPTALLTQKIRSSHLVRSGCAGIVSMLSMELRKADRILESSMKNIQMLPLQGDKLDELNKKYVDNHVHTLLATGTVLASEIGETVMGNSGASMAKVASALNLVSTVALPVSIISLAREVSSFNRVVAQLGKIQSEN